MVAVLLAIAVGCFILHARAHHRPPRPRRPPGYWHPAYGPPGPAGQPRHVRLVPKPEGDR